MAPDEPDQNAVQRMWQAYREARGIEADLAGAFAFGDSPDMADELADLVLHGPKRATAGLLLDFEHDNEPLPRPGDHQVVLDGRGEPVCVIRTTVVEVGPLNRVDAGFAWDEGEGDRTLEWWQQAHRRFFGRRCEHLGVPFTDDLPVVQERFALVWPAPRDGDDA
jgi:uncharacterized protein YhfF